jgi:hypothetical protein
MIGFPGVALKLLWESVMSRRLKSRKILIPDVPPPSSETSSQGLIVAGIGIFCAGIVTAAVLFLFFGA